MKVSWFMLGILLAAPWCAAIIFLVLRVEDEHEAGYMAGYMAGYYEAGLLECKGHSDADADSDADSDADADGDPNKK